MELLEFNNKAILSRRCTKLKIEHARLYFSKPSLNHYIVVEKKDEQKLARKEAWKAKVAAAKQLVRAQVIP